MAVNWSTATAMVGLLASGAAAGYFLGDQFSQQNIARLDSKVAALSALNEIEVEEFLRRLSELDDSMGDKESLEAVAKISAEKVGDLENIVLNLNETLEEERSKILELNGIISDFQAVISENFEELRPFTVPVKETRPLIPGRIFVGLHHVFSDSARVTITNTVESKNIAIGEGVKLNYGDKDCSVILTKIFNDAASFSLSCEKKD